MSRGGQSTLLVTPDKQSYLIDTGYAGGGTGRGWRHNRIVAAAHDAGVKQIDYLMITHFHPDHDGGVVELSKRCLYGISLIMTRCCRRR